MSITTVGIVGAGTMGNGIAQACAVSGIQVVMVDIAQAAVDKGLATIGKSLDRLVGKEKITEADKAIALGRIKGSTNYDDLQAANSLPMAATVGSPASATRRAPSAVEFAARVRTPGSSRWRNPRAWAVA